MSNPFDQFDAAPAQPVAAPAPAAAPAAEANPFDQFDVAPAAAGATAPRRNPFMAVGSAPVAGRAPQLGLTPQETSSLNAGLTRSIHDVTDKPAALLAAGADRLGLTGGVAPTAEQVTAQNAAGLADYTQQYGSDPVASAGRIGGQVLATLPVMGAVGNVAGAAGDVLAPGAGRVVPAVGNAVERVGQFLAGEGGGAGFLGRAEQAGSVAANSAIQGGAAAGLTAGQSDDPALSQIGTGAAIGGAVGPVVRGIAAVPGAIGSVIKGDANPEVARLAMLARDKYGISLTADQISSSPFLQTLGSQLRQVPGSGMAPAQAALQGQFTKAIGRTIGEDADQITPAVMARAAQRIGGVMDDVASNTAVNVDKPFLEGMQQVAKDASFLTPDRQGVINKQISNVIGSVRDGTLTGQQYQSLTNFNSPLGKALRSTDSDVRSAAIDIRGHIDDALERSLPDGSPLLDQLRTARMQYKNLKTIEPLVVKGEPGEISPALLQGQANKSFKGRGMRADQPDLGELGDIGKQFNLRPDSGTAGRAAGLAVMGTLGSAATQAFTGSPMNALMTAAAVPAGMLASRGAGAYLRSPNTINKLLESGLAGPATQSSVNPLLPYAAPLAAIGVGRALNR
jgi:hypothetical protein